MNSHLKHWAPLGIALIILALSLAVLANHRRIGHWMAQAWATPPENNATGNWPGAMKDEDKSLLVATPAPRQIELVRESSFQKFYRGDSAKKWIALTFDDGPHPDSTPKLLAMLKKYNVKATFFIVGAKAEAHPELIKAEAADGHCLANHTFNHDRLTKVPNAAVPAEITTCTEIIKKITGKSTRLFRPPGGTFDRKVTDIAQSLGYLTILWTTNTGDFECSDPRIIEARALRNAENGTIILFHDKRRATIDALPGIITQLRARGYQFVTIDEMVANK